MKPFRKKTLGTTGENNNYHSVKSQRDSAETRVYGCHLQWLLQLEKQWLEFDLEDC